MIKFPSIDQFRSTVKRVRDRARWAGRDDNGDPIFDPTRPVPILKFDGTVKLHGTNASVVLDRSSEDFSYQSRERVLTLEQDNAGFMLHMKNHEESLDNIFTTLMLACGGEEVLDAVKNFVIYGEWCGANIQKGVGISGLPKMFVIFALRINFKEDSGYQSVWLPVKGFPVDELVTPESKIFNVYDFGHYEVEIDFNHPELSQQKLIEMTEEVEALCPAGKFFGNEGIGEGIVWHCEQEGWRSSDFWFKVKGEKHSVSKVKTLAPIDVEAYKKQQDFIDSVVTEARLEQGLQNLINEQQKPFDMTSMGDFIRWVFNDIMKEETDTIVANQFDPKKIGGPIANKARPWYIARFNSQE